MPMPLSDSLYPLLVCPRDHSSLVRSTEDALCCDTCKVSFPVRSGVPVLIDPANALFSHLLTTAPTLPEVAGFPGVPVRNRDTRAAKVKTCLKTIIPDVGANWVADRNYEQLRTLLLRSTANPVILIVGSGEIGEGLRNLLGDNRLTIVETDVWFGGRTNVIVDGHELPFCDEAFDAVICQAVLEHVLDPQRCVGEIHRVLKPGGLVYAETPFMQQVHMGAHDFTRYTLLGHRRLFRFFDQESSGMTCGPGMALAWSVQYFLRCFSSSLVWKALVRLTSFALCWLKFVDYWLMRKPASADAASGFFFLGRKRQSAIPDCEILELHWSRRQPAA